MPLTLTSASFQNGGMIPVRHTCDGGGISPPLRWSGVPTETQSLVLIVDDPDAPDPEAPKMTWVHWILYNIPSQATELGEGLGYRQLPVGTMQGLNDWGRAGYGGPCPPIGRHRYFFKLFALHAMMRDLKAPNKVELEKTMRRHVIAQTELVGLYQRRLSLATFV